MLSVFMTPWMKPTSIHRATSDAWASTTLRRTRGTGLGVRPPRAVAGDGVVGEAADQSGSPGRRRTGRCRPAGGSRRRGRGPRRAARVSRAMSSPVPTTASAGWSGCRGRASPRRSRTPAASGRRRPCRRRRGRRGCAPSPSGAGRGGRPWTSIISPSSSARPSPSRGEYAAELVPGVRLGDGRGALGDGVADQHVDAGVGVRSASGSSPSSAASASLSASSRGAGDRRALPGHVEALEVADEGVVEDEQRLGGDAHAIRLARDVDPGASDEG